MPRTCKVCKTKFEPQFNSVQPTCGYKCAIEYAKNLREKKEKKEWKARKKVLSITAKSKNHKADLQRNINKLARLIDAQFKLRCIDCDKDYGKQIDGAHFHSRGSNATLSFHLHNIHSAKSDCNQFSSEHKVGYIKGLKKRYGQEYYEYVEYTLQQHPLIKLTEQEIYDKKTLTAKLIRDFDTFEFTNPMLARDQLNKIIGIYEEREPRIN